MEPEAIVTGLEHRHDFDLSAELFFDIGFDAHHLVDQPGGVMGGEFVQGNLVFKRCVIPEREIIDRWLPIFLR